MRAALALVLLATVSLSQNASAQSIAGDAAVQAQWFTGSLEAPSPALPAAGILAVEPYFVFTSTNGSYDNSGARHSISNGSDVFTSETVLKYAITDRLSVEALPSFSHNLNNNDSYTGLGDLPLEAEYRFNDEDNKTGYPSVTASLGMTLPTGHFDNLNAALDGFGSGVYTAKEGILAQSLFDTWGHHPMRLRFYGAAYEPVSNVSVQGNSVYGTSKGFLGTAMPGLSSVLGIGAGYGLDQRWVLAFDVVQNFANGLHLQGTNGGIVTNTHGTSSAALAVAPAIEYNFSDNLGIIAGVEFSVAGRNTPSYVAPQIALSTSF
jgi:hypothetical protein